ncbi:flagellar hook-length control protein FliK [Nitrosomonas sp.]|uniref:flagellar hook-length control protein FliK n=1 Tax=Nitrosomonas sp. TaxID=42353 RepID=UPI0025E63348|nr:flagellar hook-length control protein FliK [Nitrosomonas sp.]MCC6916490.1 flagellar hook-length control protein FliK [Nitrosomonas sp.]
MISNPINPAVILSATPVDTVSQTRPVNPITPVPDATQSDTPPFVPGQKYMAQIGERLADGHSIVNVAGKWLQMRMPASVNTGDVLELTLIEQAPRLKFLLQNNIQGSSNPTTLSQTGKFIAQLLNQPVSTATKTANETIPLLPAPPATSTEKAHLSSQLQQALSASGLFYESHLAQWLNGGRSLQQLRQEPQSRLPVFTPTAAAATDPASPVAPQAAALVQQQLHTLETGVIQWRGEIWPGQVAEWDITEHLDDREQAGEPSGKSGRWQTRIHLQLPNLGKITATLMIEPQGMRIRLDTESDEITQQLKKEQLTLANAMQTTGLTIQAMEIQQHENT